MDVLGFWIIAGGMGLVVALSLALGFRRTDRDGLDAAESDLLVYKDQLAEIDRDVARGILPETEADAVRLEVKRRILAADKQAQNEAKQKDGPSRGPAVALVVAVVAAAGALYATIGAPGYPDLPLERRIALIEEARETRPGQVQAEAEAALRNRPVPDVDEEFMSLMEQLRTALEERPDDVQGFRLLAQNEARLGRFSEARQAQERVVSLIGDDASAADWVELAELMVAAADGYVSPEAEAAVSEALSLDPSLGLARYYKGLAEAQVGRTDLAYQTWRALLAESRRTDPWVRVIENELPAVAEMAGVPFRPEQRPDFGENEEMIREMVEGLAARLANQGGTAEDWARLVHSLAVLGEHDQAEAIAAEARTVFASDQEAIDMIARALQGSGGRR